MDNIIRLLGEWKERILFGIVLLLALLITTNAVWTGAGITDVYNEEYTSAIKSTGIEGELGGKAIEALKNPPDVSPKPPNPLAVDKIHYNERNAYVSTSSSGWMLIQEDFESLPPLSLPLPTYTGFADFDAPAGLSPQYSKLMGIVPRDTRSVSLAEANTSEFGND